MDLKSQVTAASALVFLLACEELKAYPVIDQSNDLVAPSLFQNIGFFSPIGQEFTPSASRADFVDLFTKAFEPDKAADLAVQILRDSIDGELVGTSATTSLAANFTGVTRFAFPKSALLLPSTRYVMRVLLLSDTQWGIGSTGGPNSTYLLGDQILNGAAQDNNDLWFREGYNVPEPTTLALLALGALAVVGGARSVKTVARGRAI